MKIKTLVISLMLLVVCGSYAQTVSYSYKPLAEEGCCVYYSIAKQDSRVCKYNCVKATFFINITSDG